MKQNVWLGHKKDETENAPRCTPPHSPPPAVLCFWQVGVEGGREKHILKLFCLSVLYSDYFKIIKLFFLEI